MFGFGFGWGNQLAALFGTILAVFLCRLAFSALVAVTFLLVRFLWVGTRAAQLYIAQNGGAVRKTEESATEAAAPGPATGDEAVLDLFASSVDASDTLTPQPAVVEDSPPAKPKPARRPGRSRTSATDRGAVPSGATAAPDAAAAGAGALDTGAAGADAVGADAVGTGAVNIGTDEGSAPDSPAGPPALGKPRTRSTKSRTPKTPPGS